jgi:hypothetical protein
VIAGRREINRYEATILEPNYILKPLTNDKKLPDYFEEKNNIGYGYVRLTTALVK